jgi:hypothetical protein
MIIIAVASAIPWTPPARREPHTRPGTCWPPSPTARGLFRAPGHAGQIRRPLGAFSFAATSTGNDVPALIANEKGQHAGRPETGPAHVP